MPSGTPGTPRVVPTGPDDATTLGSTGRGTPNTASSSSDQVRVRRSNNRVRDALVTSVACTAPPVSRHSRYESTVPNASSPAAAAAAAVATRSNSQPSLVPEKYGSIGRPV